MSAPVGRDTYRAVVARSGECPHGVQGGDVVRPWTMSPACALCRRRHGQHWRYITTPIDPHLDPVNLDEDP